MFAGLSTRFDGTVVLEAKRALVEKILLEYKTAKSSEGQHIDGNAHERLSFQVMQYLEIATRYTKCSLVILANAAFIKFKNKYHVNFKLQADRLTAFSWFDMKHVCTTREYCVFAEQLSDWLLGKGKGGLHS
jgi:hypothetical protein